MGRGVSRVSRTNHRTTTQSDTKCNALFYFKNYRAENDTGKNGGNLLPFTSWFSFARRFHRMIASKKNRRKRWTKGDVSSLEEAVNEITEKNEWKHKTIQ